MTLKSDCNTWKGVALHGARQGPLLSVSCRVKEDTELELRKKVNCSHKISTIPSL